MQHKIKSKLLISIFATIMLLALSGCSLSSCDSQTFWHVTDDSITSSISSDFEVATVTRIVDGDTFTCTIDNSEYTVRLIGVETAESVHPDSSKNTTEGEAASEHTKNILPVGTIVYLQKDTSETDIYGRLLRYVWLEEPTNTTDLAEIKTKMLNAILVIDGWATPKAFEPDTTYKEIFEYLAEN